MSDEEIQRFDVPVRRQKLIEIYRSMRNYFERVAAAKGESLDPSWYEDGPEQMPQLYGDQPHLLRKAEECAMATGARRRVLRGLARA